MRCGLRTLLGGGGRARRGYRSVVPSGGSHSRPERPARARAVNTCKYTECWLCKSIENYQRVSPCMGFFIATPVCVTIFGAESCSAWKRGVPRRRNQRGRRRGRRRRCAAALPGASAGSGPPTRTDAAGQRACAGRASHACDQRAFPLAASVTVLCQSQVLRHHGSLLLFSFFCPHRHVCVSDSAPFCAALSFL